MSAAKATSLRGDRPTGRARGFTLVEMLVVLAIIALIMGASLPSIRVLFTSGADAEAYNLLAAQLRGARALAIQQQTHAAVHIRLYDETMTDADPKLTGAFFVVLLVEEDFVPGEDIHEDEVFDDPDDPDRDNLNEFGTVRRFVLAPGFEPRQLSRPMACGDLRTEPDGFSGADGFVDMDADPDEYMNIANDDDVEDFTTVTVVFTPAGGLARDYPVRLANRVVAKTDEDGNPIAEIDFTKSRILFSDFPLTQDVGNEIAQDELAPFSLWAYPPLGPSGDPDPEEGAENLVLFDYGAFDALPKNDLARSDYLRGNGRILAINPYTGQMLGGE